MLPTSPPCASPIPQSGVESEDSVHSDADDNLDQVPLTPELAANIIKQVEFYFSDANLATDKKLLKTVRKTPNGFVPVKLFTNFRKVRALSKDAATIAMALQGSTALQLSEDGTKVRRLAEIPQYDVEDIQRRTIVVEHLGPTPTIQSVTDKFSVYGKVNLVRICTKESKGKLPHWLTATTHAISSQQHAFVEFCDADAAVMAVAALHEADEWGGTMTARHLLVAPSDKNGHITPIPLRRSGPSRSNSQASIGTPPVAPARRNLPMRSDSQASIGSPSAALIRRSLPTRSDSQTSIGSPAPARLALRLLEKPNSERAFSASLDTPASPLRPAMLTCFSGLSSQDAATPGTPTSATSAAAAQALLLGIDRNTLKEHILNDVDGFVEQLLYLNSASLHASPRVSNNGSIAAADLPARVAGLTITCPKPAALGTRPSQNLGDATPSSNRSVVPSGLSPPVEVGSPSQQGLWSRRAAGSPHPSLTPSRWQSYDEDLTSILADKDRQHDSVPSSPGNNNHRLSGGRNRPLHHVPECPATARWHHASDGGVARGGANDCAQDTSMHARLQDTRVPGSPGSPAAKLGKGGKKDYASWAAATPEYRNAATVPPKRMSRCGMEGAAAATANASVNPDQLVQIARGPDGSSGFGSRVRTPRACD